MSMFKRKQSKDKDLGEKEKDKERHQSIAASPPISQGQAQGRGGNYVTPPMANGRRMASNPVHPTQMPQGILQSNQSSLSLNGYDQTPPGPGSAGPNHFGQQPQHPQPQSQPGSGGLPPQSLSQTQSQALATQPPRPPSAPPTTYPWSTRPIRLYAPSTSPPTVAQSPFPRYGLSVPTFPSHSGHMLIFGGLVHESVRNDLWSMDVRDCTTMTVKTKGDAPMPRVGHAAAIADRIMIVWGGDTKVRPEDAQDEGLYILDLRTQEWTKVPVQPGPVGRYGHAVTMHDSKFYIFGGQAEGAFMNDLWSYDIRQCDRHMWEQVQFRNQGPPKRTGHIMSSHAGKIYVFGGTDGNFHYNDTWCLDIASGEWAELSCIGYIPVPREGHAAAMVDDVIYVFGGRDVNGKDLGDLAAFRTTNQRWYMFQNMGPAPTPRSGHAMVAAHGKVFVVGGEANASSASGRDDPSLVHILDSSKIKYPPDNHPPRSIKSRPSDAPTEKSYDRGNTVMSPPLTERAVNLPSNNSPPKSNSESPVKILNSNLAQGQGQRGIQPSESMDSLQESPERGMVTQSQSQPPVSQSPRQMEAMQQQQQQMLYQQQLMQQQQQQMQQAQQQQPVDSQQQEPVELAPPIRPPPIQPQQVPQQLPNGSSQPQTNGPPQRPRREGDEEYRRAMSPQNLPPSPTNPTHRVVSPTNKNGFNASILGTRSPSPRMRMADHETNRPVPPADAFYYGRSPTTNGFSPQVRPNSLLGSQSSELMSQLKNRDTELEAGRKREAGLRTILAKAMQGGFVAEYDDDESENGDPDRDGDDDEDLVGKLTDALVRLKHEKASIQNELAVQVRSASDKAMEAEQLRRGALQEAAFYRAKVATLEGNAPTDLSRIEKDRVAELERQLGALSSELANSKRELQTKSTPPVSAVHSPRMDRDNDAIERAEEAEEAHRLALQELSELQAKHSNVEMSLRELNERFISTSSTAQQREAERDQLKTHLQEAESTHDEHLAVIAEAQAAIASAGARTTQVEQLHSQATARITELEAELQEAKQLAEAHSREVESTKMRLRDIETSHAQSREEAESLRSVTTGRLGQLLESHKARSGEQATSTRGHLDQVRALEEEGSSLRKMLREAGQRVDAAESGVSTHRDKARELELALRSTKAEMRGHKSRLAAAQGELQRYKEMWSGRDLELREREGVVTEMETRVTVLRNLLADHGIAVHDSDLDTHSSDTPDSRELESKLRDRTRAHEASQREIEDLTRRCHEAEDKVESLGRLVDRIKDARSPTAMSARSPTPPGVDRGDYEARMSEMEMKHQEKIKQVESDYQTAVRYVKGSEKMLKRMKDELNKQKSANQSLQSEIDSLSGRSSTEPGSRTRDASGRATPTAFDSDLSRRHQTLQMQHQTLQTELSASRDILAAREREVELLRQRVDEAEQEVARMREELGQAQARIETLLEMGQGGFEGSEDGDRGESEEGSEEASMAFDKFSKELKQWDRTRGSDIDSEDDDTAQYNLPGSASNHSHKQASQLAQGMKSPIVGGATTGKLTGAGTGKGVGVGGGHKRNSSEYSGDWVQ